MRHVWLKRFIIGKEYIIPTLGVWEHFDDIDFDKLPDQFVLKCTHDSGGLVICKDKETLDKEKAKKQIEHCLKRRYFLNTREWPYKDVKPQIIAEKYMVDESGYELKDYKPKLSVLSQGLHLIVLIPLLIYSAQKGYATLYVARSLVRFQAIFVDLVILWIAVKISPIKMIENMYRYIIATLGIGAIFN